MLANKSPEKDRYIVYLIEFFIIFMLMIIAYLFIKLPSILGERRRTWQVHEWDLKDAHPYSDYQLLEKYNELIMQRNTLDVFIREFMGELTTIDIFEQNATQKPTLFYNSSFSQENTVKLIVVNDKNSHFKHRELTMTDVPKSHKIKIN